MSTIYNEQPMYRKLIGFFYLVKPNGKPPLFGIEQTKAAAIKEANKHSDYALITIEPIYAGVYRSGAVMVPAIICDQR